MVDQRGLTKPGKREGIPISLWQIKHWWEVLLCYSYHQGSNWRGVGGLTPQFPCSFHCDPNPQPLSSCCVADPPSSFFTIRTLVITQIQGYLFIYTEHDDCSDGHAILKSNCQARNLIATTYTGPNSETVTSCHFSICTFKSLASALRLIDYANFQRQI